MHIEAVAMEVVEENMVVEAEELLSTLMSVLVVVGSLRHVLDKVVLVVLMEAMAILDLIIIRPHPDMQKMGQIQ